MDCERVAQEEIAEQYVSRQLSAEAQDAFEIHLLECARCRQSVEAFETLRSVLVETEGNIRLHRSRIAGRVRWAWMAAAAAALVIGGIGINTLRVRRTTRVTPAPLVTSATTPPVQQQTPATISAKQPPAPESQKPMPRSVPVAPPPEVPQVANAVSSVEVVPRVPPGVTDVTPTQPPMAATTPPKTEPRSVGANDQIAAELFRLATVEPAPYTFSGFNTGKAGRHAPAPGYSQPGSALAARANFQEAMARYVEGKYNGAAELLENADKADPGAVEVNFYLGVCRLLLGRPGESISPLKTAIAKGSSPLLQPAHFYLAKAYLQTKDLARAESELEAASSMPGRLTAEAASLLTKVLALRAKGGNRQE